MNRAKRILGYTLAATGCLVLIGGQLWAFYAKYGAKDTLIAIGAIVVLAGAIAGGIRMATDA